MLSKYYRWLHGRWPAGRVEKLPVVREDGTTNVPGLYVTGDLKGVPLLKFAVDSGARAAERVANDLAGQSSSDGDSDVLDLAIIGGGVSGMAAAVEAKRRDLHHVVLEASEPFSTIVNFPKGKPIFTYPTGFAPAGELEVTSDVKEGLLEELERQSKDVEVRQARVLSARRKGKLFEIELSGGDVVKARRVIVALGRSGNHRRLGVPGEELPKVYNRLHDPKEYQGQRALVVGGGDSAVETAVALAQCGADVTIAYRGEEFTRPKPENIERLQALAVDPAADVEVNEPCSERVTTAAGPFLGDARQPGALTVRTETSPVEVRDGEVVLKSTDGETTIPNDVVFSMIGREPPLDFFRRSGVHVHGEWRAATWVGLGAFLAFCWAYYDIKSNGPVGSFVFSRGWFPYSIPTAWADLFRPEAADTFLGVCARSMQYPGFWATLLYSIGIVFFGIRRIRRRRTQYVTVQTTVLMLVQVLPLFLLPEILLPLADKKGWLPDGFFEALFPAVSYGNGREYWRAYGFILAFPLNIYNVFTPQPMPWWIGISIVQTLIMIPGAIYLWGKGAYCGWLCSCGAMAETMGDAHREKMPHGPGWNRLNLLGQAILVIALIGLALRIIGWYQPPTSSLNVFFAGAFMKSYKWVVDIGLAGFLGLGLYFWFSGRTWCRFACPLAALMHVYARFSRFAIISEKKKCISCNVCTSVCHQGIDVMNFANKGLPMQDPQCVRCSACVGSCPTGTLTFGRVDGQGTAVSYDALVASAVQARERATAQAAG